MTGIVRLIALLFFVLAFFEGLTFGHVALGLINCAIFAALALAVVRFFPERWGNNGRVYGMSGAFFISLLTPFVLYLFFGEEPCEGADCDVAAEEAIAK